MSRNKWMDDLVHKYRLPKEERPKKILSESQLKQILKDVNTKRTNTKRTS